MRPGQNAFWASRSMTTESLPPEKSSTGRSNSAATSRMMWIDSASMARRFDNWYCPASPAPLLFSTTADISLRGCIQK